MTTPRFRTRHVHKSCVDYLKTGLDDLGWVTAPINFGTNAVTFMDYQPDEAGVTVAPNTVAFTFGDEPADVDEELGTVYGGLQSCDYTLFVDIYGASTSIAVSIASDVKALLKRQIITLRDYNASAAGVATGNSIEFDEVIVAAPTSAAIDKRHWRVVKATARLYFNE